MNKKVLTKIKLLILIVVICLGVWFLGISPILTFRSNEEKLTKAAKRYYELNPDKLPTGERVRTLYLNTLYKESYIENDFKMPYTGKICSIEKSWVKVVRDNDDYKYYTYLDCGTLKSNIDHDGPKITLNGDTDITVDYGEKFNDPGIKSVVDNVDGKIKVENVEIKGEVDTNKPGSYIVQYIALDSLNNKSVVERKVNVKVFLNNIVKNDLKGNNNYSGIPKNNYIYFSNMLFRIYGITSDKNVMLISNEDVANVNYSKIEKWLDEIYYPSLTKSAKKLIVKSKFCNMAIDPSELGNIKDCRSYTKKRNVYIPSILEFNSANDNDALNYLKNSTVTWTANSSSNGKAYNTSNFFFDENFDKSYKEDSVDFNFGVRPMIVIKGKTVIKGGNGSLDSPYNLGEVTKASGGQLLNSRYTGEYIDDGGLIWRIIGVQDDGTTKVISSGTLSDRDGRIQVASMTGYKYLTYDPNNKDNVAYYINNRVSKNFDAKNFVTHEIEVPIYKKKIIYSEQIKTKTYKVKFSAPNMYEMFSAQPNENAGHVAYSYWLVNSTENSMLQGVIYDSGIPENESLSYYQRLGVRVTGFINKNKVISSGEGTYEKPYKIK